LLITQSYQGSFIGRQAFKIIGNIAIFQDCRHGRFAIIGVTWVALAHIRLDFLKWSHLVVAQYSISIKRRCLSHIGTKGKASSTAGLKYLYNNSNLALETSDTATTYQGNKDVISTRITTDGLRPIHQQGSTASI
jgi:hypothetical protein